MRASASGATFADSKFGPETVARLRAAFERSLNPMLIADDQRRWVTGNAAACEMLGLSREEIPWFRIDDFTAPSNQRRLEAIWEAFLTTGSAEGSYEFDVPDRGPVPVKFSATANVLPARHVSVLVRLDEELTEPVSASTRLPAPVVAEDSGRLQLTDREREVMTLVASGLRSGDIAERLFLSPETVKSHVHNSMAKLGSHTRPHAVAIALVTGQIEWEP